MLLMPSLSCSDPAQGDGYRCPAAEAVVVVKLKAEVAVAGDRAFAPCSTHSLMCGRFRHPVFASVVCYW
jgi:hypothetical protein